jgi:hypothetical protein
MISTRSLELVIDTVVCLTLAKWETVSGQFGGLAGVGRMMLQAGLGLLDRVFPNFATA